ncbi:MAG: pilus assembly protein N-terminal domain-containing protein, partial [Planctomycetaceae bacterium]
MPTLLGYRRRPFWLLLGLAAALLTSGELFAQPPEDAATADRDVVLVDTPRTHIEIIEKFSRVLELKNKIIRVDGFDPAVLNITALSAHQVRMQALTPGVTSVVL